MILRTALLSFLMAFGEPAAAAPSLSSSSSSSSRDVLSSSASSATDIHDICVSINDDAYGSKKKWNAMKQRKKLHQLHDPSPSSELENRQDHRINGDSSTRSDASKKVDIGYLGHHRLPKDHRSEEALRRNLESREAYCANACSSKRPKIQANGYDLNILINDRDLNEPIGCWDTSAVTDMSTIFFFKHVQ